MDSSETTLIEFCAGYGGIGIGLGRVIERLRTIALCEIESFAIENLVAKMEAGRIDACPVWNDLKSFPSSEFHGMVDILSAGFPCQPFSCAGLRRGDDDPRHLFPYIMESVVSIQPRFVFLENVEGLISAKLGSDCWADPLGTPVLLHVLRELERRGYKATWGVFSASEVGAPHQRKRVFILANSIVQGLQRSNITREDSKEACGRQEGAHGRAGQLCGLYGSVWPSRPGQPQYAWEPPRVVENSVSVGRRGMGEDGVEHTGGQLSKNKIEKPCKSQHFADGEWQTQPTLGGNSDGSASGMDYAELCESSDNRVDELRLLGNGVVPATAAKAWQVLHDRLMRHD